MSLPRSQLQLIRWTSALLSGAIVLNTMVSKPEGGWAVLSFFGAMIVGAPAALLTLHLMEQDWKARRK